MTILKQLRFRLGSARHAHRLHQEIDSLRRERDALLATHSIGDESRVRENEAALGYGKSGHYRKRVGPKNWYDQLAALQVSLLFVAGLRDTHRLADVGCGSLRAGRMLIPYLRPGGYFGIEPEKWLVEEGIKEELGHDILKVKRPSFRFVADFSLDGFDTTFDFVLCQSVFSHTSPDLLRLGLGNIADSLSPTGKLLATFRKAELGGSRIGIKSGGEVLPNGWVVSGGYRYTWEELEEHLRESGLVGRRINWPHQNQSWFVACKAGSEAEETIEKLSRQIHPPRPKWGKRYRGTGKSHDLHWE